MQRGAWLATVHETAKSWTQCSNEHNTTVVFQYFSISFYRNISLNLSGLGLILLNSQVYFYQITCKLQINFYFSESYTLLSHVQLFATSWTIQSMEFSRPEYWSGQLFPSPRDLPNPGIEPRSPALQEDSLPTEPPGKHKNYWSEQPVPSPADLPYPGIELGSPAFFTS